VRLMLKIGDQLQPNPKVQIQIGRFIFPLAIFLIGFWYFFEPFLSHWFEIVYPLIARSVFFPFDWILIFGVLTNFSFFPFDFWIPDLVFLIIFGMYLVFYLKVVRQKWLSVYAKFARMPSIIFPIIWVLLLPLGFTYFGRGINASVVGGWSRLMLAGGPSVVRTESMGRLESGSESSLSYSDLPPALQKWDIGWKSNTTIN